MRRFLNRFWFHGLVAGLMLAALWQAYGPYAGGVAVFRQVDAAVKVISVGELADVVDVPLGKPVLLVMHASWCPPCHGMMQLISAMLTDGELTAIQPVFLSFDKDKVALVDEWVRLGLAGKAVPYWLQAGQDEAMDRWLKQRGGKALAGLPRLIMLDQKGRVFAEISGEIDRPALMALVAKPGQSVRPAK